MNKKEQLEQLKQGLRGIRLAHENSKRAILEKHLLPIVQGCCDKDFKVKLTNSFGDWYCNITFDLNDWEKEFGLDFSIRVYKKLIDLSHGSLSGDTTQVRAYLIERDKIIARLWDKNDEIVACFEEVSKETNKYWDTCWELERQITEVENSIKEEETKEVLNQMTIGSKWVFSWDIGNKRPITITKITPKTIYFERDYQSWGDNSKQMKIKDMVSYFKNGSVKKYEDTASN